MTQEFIYNSIRWQDIFDILLISYVLFRLYVLFKGTNVFHVLVSFLVLWFFQKVALSMGLIVTSWAVQAFTAVAPIIIIVIFRNEIRSVLQAKNFRAIFWGAPYHEPDTPVDIIAESIFEMASKGVGSIMVIPGKEELTESVHSGIRWDGRISKEMMLSIFWHENPVHDGAAVITGDRISEVGAVLPLSRRKDLPSYYGMRHRAAVGLSEVSDAMVILSSEERNNVMIARSGKIISVENREKLCTEINDHLEIPGEKPADKRKQNLELAMIALVSLVFITGIWLSFTRGIDTYITLDVPVEYTRSNPEIIVMDASVKTVSLDLSGSGRLLKGLAPEQVKVGIDLGSGEIGRNVFNITNENITLPPGIFLRNTTPSSLNIVLDKIVRKNVPVQADWKGKPAKDVLVTKVSFKPEMAVLSGPSLILDEISTVYTDKISLENIRQSGKMDVNLDLNNNIKIENSVNGKFTMEYSVDKRSTAKAE